MRVTRAVALACLAAALAFAAPSFAQNSAIAGEWVFEAPLEPDDGCVITGRATITPSGEPDTFDVVTRGEETCPFGEWRTEQHCTGALEDAILQIECTLASVEPYGYAPDHFLLNVIGPSLMQGRLLSAREGPAVWRRAPAPLVS